MLSKTAEIQCCLFICLFLLGEAIRKRQENRSAERSRTLLRVHFQRLPLWFYKFTFGFQQVSPTMQVTVSPLAKVHTENAFEPGGSRFVNHW